MSVLALIALILSAADETTATEFKSEFYTKFRQRLYNRCATIAQKRFGNDPEWRVVAEDTVQETFIFVIDNLNRFKYDPSWTEEIAEKKVLAWLTAIARHKLLDYFSGKQGASKNLKGYRYDVAVGANTARSTDPKKYRVQEREILNQAMNQLSPVQRHVLLTYIEFDCFINSKKHLPAHAMKSLCEKYQIKPAAIRQLKKRAWDTVRKLCFEKTDDT